MLESTPCGRVSALRLGGRGFDPRPGHTKDYKNGTHCLPAWHSASGVGIGGLDHHMIPERSTAAAHRSLRGWVKCGEQISHIQVCDNQWNFTFTFT